VYRSTAHRTLAGTAAGGLQSKWLRLSVEVGSVASKQCAVPCSHAAMIQG
jgi:hypothetical protein